MQPGSQQVLKPRDSPEIKPSLSAKRGRDRGSNVHLAAVITLRRKLLDAATSDDNLGKARQMLGARESGTARLEEAVAAYRDALTEYTRERTSLNWATIQNNLGNPLSTLGERESGTARLEEAVAAYRDALTETTRDRAPRAGSSAPRRIDLVV